MSNASEGRPESRGEGKYSFSQKWGDDPFTQMGHTQVPNALVEYAARLGLRSEECWLICCILKFKHTPDAPYPKQETLARLFGQSVDTVQRTTRKIVDKKLLKIERARLDDGAFSHTVYDFTPLRFALNECYYQDHPQERPQGPAPLPGKAKEPTPQNCGLGQNTLDTHTAELRPGFTHEPHRRSAASATPQICGPKEKQQSEKDVLKKDSSSRRARGKDASGSNASAAAAASMDIDRETTELAERLREAGVNRSDALRFALAQPDECRRQLEYLPFVSEFKTSRGAYLRTAIEQGFAAPIGWEKARQQKSKASSGSRTGASAAARRHEEERAQVEQRLQAVRELRAQLEAADPERWRSLIVEAETQMAVPIRNRPSSPGYQAALNAFIAARYLPAQQTS